MSYAKATKNILIKNINKFYKHLVNKIKAIYLYQQRQRDDKAISNSRVH